MVVTLTRSPPTFFAKSAMTVKLATTFSGAAKADEVAKALNVITLNAKAARKDFNMGDGLLAWGLCGPVSVVHDAGAQHAARAEQDRAEIDDAGRKDDRRAGWQRGVVRQQQSGDAGGKADQYGEHAHRFHAHRPEA